MTKPKFYLIDAMAFCYRAFYAVRGLSTSYGQPTGAIFGFVNILNKVLKEQRPDYLAVCFDVSRDTFRLEKFKEYKIHRKPMPDDLSSQIPLIKDIVRAYNIVIFEKAGFEADDVIATLTKKAKGLDADIIIVSSDKDIMQLIDENVKVFSPYKDEGSFYDKTAINARFNVEPQHIVDIVALMGDAVDNIPGAKGIGEKTAIELIGEFKDIDNLLDKLSSVKSEKLKKILKENLEIIKLSRDLAVLNENVPLDFNIDALKVINPDYHKLYELFKRLEFKNFLKNIPLENDTSQQVALDTCKEADLDKNNIREILICENSLLVQGDKICTFDKAGTQIKAILSDSEIKKSGYDLKAVKLRLLKRGINLSGLHFDVMIAAYLLNPAKPQYSLNEIAWDYFNTAYPNDNLSDTTIMDLVKRLMPKLADELKKKSLDELFYSLEMPLVDVLADMEASGISLDIKVLKGLSRDIEARLIKLIDKIYKISGCQFNINSPKQLSEVLFIRLKLPVLKKTKTGASTNEEVLKALADKHELPVFLLEYRQLMKLKNTYIDVLPTLLDPDTGKIHTSFNQTGTETGRLSSSNPNLQNIPMKTDIGRNIRRAIVPSKKGDFLVSCDYSQIELRILAHISKDDNLIDAFKKDKDIHRFTASLLYNTEEESASDEMREVAKRVNFGIVYGLSPFGLAADLGMPHDQARAFIEAYFARYPKVKVYVDQQIERAKKCGFVTTILGRRRYLPEINNKNQGIRQFAERQAMNTPIQGSAADLIKLAMVEIHHKLKEQKLKTTMVLQVHDELVFEMPKDEFKVATKLIRQSMENVLKLDVPVVVNIKRGQNWLEMEEVK